MRELSKDFLNNLKSAKGLLHPILERVEQDDTLMLAIRDNYINIYYRGGSLLKVKEQGKDSTSHHLTTNTIDLEKPSQIYRLLSNARTMQEHGLINFQGSRK